MSKKKKNEKTAKVVIKDQEEVTESVKVKQGTQKEATKEKQVKDSNSLSNTLANIDRELDGEDIERDPIISAAILIVVSILVSAVMISASILYLAVSGGAAGRGGVADDGAALPGEEVVQAGEVEILDDDPYMGKEDAQVVMVEFSDYECPFCKRFHTQTFEQIKDEYIENRRIGYVWKDFPLGFHNPLATQQAAAAQCVMKLEGDEKYFEYADLLFDTTESGGNGMDEGLLNDLAVEIGVDKEDFDNCYDNEETLEKVEQGLDVGAAAGIAGTPGFVIGIVEDGVVKGELVSGALPFTNFEDVIDSYLEQVE